MTKPIINSIDVSECNAYKDKHCKNETSIMFTEYNLCSNFPNCYFKQLKRLQAENEELRKYQYTQEYLQSEIEKRQKALEEIRTFAKPIKENTCFGMYCGFVDWILETIDEVLNDRD